MNSRTRSPNYPSISLEEAIEAIKKVYAHERRAKFPRASLAAHLGYTSINGRSLAKIGAIRGYGLIDGKEDALSVSPTAIAIIEAPEGSRDRADAYRDAFLSPTIFARAYEQYGDTPPSPPTFRWWLTQQGYIGDAADKAMQSYLDSLELVNSVAGLPESFPSESGSETKGGFSPTLDDMINQIMPPPGASKAKVTPEPLMTPEQTGLATGVQERVLQSGMLSKTASYRVIVSGPVGVAEIDRLLQKLELDKEILADLGPDSSGDEFDDLLGG
jgi:hypothetical protein